MADLIETPEWAEGIYQLEQTDPVVGGPDGIDNIQAKQLANRTVFLKNNIDEINAQHAVAQTLTYPHVFTDNGILGVVTIVDDVLIIPNNVAFNLGGVNFNTDDYPRDISITSNYGLVIFKPSNGFTFISATNEAGLSAHESTHTQMICYDINNNTVEPVRNDISLDQQFITSMTLSDAPRADNYYSQSKKIKINLSRKPLAVLRGFEDMLDMSGERHLIVIPASRREIELVYQATSGTTNDWIRLHWSITL